MLFFANRWYSLLTEYHLIFFANSKLRRDAHYFSRQTLRNFSLSLAVSGPRALALALAFALALAPYQNGHETSSRRHLPQFPGSPPKATHHCGKRQNAESPAQEQNQCQRSINIRLQSTANSRLSVTLNCDLGQPLEFPTLTSDLHWRPDLILSKSKSGWWQDFPSRGRLRKMDEALSRSQRENSVQKLNTLFIKSTEQDWLQKRALEYVSIALANQVESWSTSEIPWHYRESWVPLRPGIASHLERFKLLMKLWSIEKLQLQTMDLDCTCRWYNTVHL